MHKRALVFLAEGFEEIEAVTTIDILRRAGIEVIIAGLNAKAVKGSRDIMVVADVSLDEVNQEFDAYILPGGSKGAENLAGSSKVKDMLLQARQNNKIIAAICAAPAVVLAPAGLLEGKSATCYPDMERDFSKSTRFSDQAVVIDGNLITSRGPATAFEFAMAIAEKLAGREISAKVAKATLAAG